MKLDLPLHLTLTHPCCNIIVKCNIGWRKICIYDLWTYVFSVRIKRPVAGIMQIRRHGGARHDKMGRENNRLRWPLSLLFFAMSKVDWQHVANFPSLEEAENYLSSQNVRKQRISKLKASKKSHFLLSSLYTTLSIATSSSAFFERSTPRW